MLLDTATEKIGHVEMLATMVARLLETSPVEAEKAAENGSDRGVLGTVLGGGDTQHAVQRGRLHPARFAGQSLERCLHYSERQPAGRHALQRHRRESG